MKKVYGYFPIWLLLIMPSMLILTLSFNFMMSLIGLLITFLIYDRKNMVNKMFKNVLKLWGVTVLLDIVTVIFMLAPELLYKLEFINENLIRPLETNPYFNVVSFIYVALLVFINLFISFKLIKKILTKWDLEKRKKSIATTIMMFFVFPYLFFMPSSTIIKTEFNTLNDYRGTVLENKAKVGAILKHINTTDYISSYVLETHVEPYTINIYLKELSLMHQKEFEQDAAILFNLIDNVNEINYFIGDSSYRYTINSINAIFKNVKKLSIEDINERYNSSNFENYVYLGRLGEYDVFDTSEFCELEKQLLFEVNDIKYFLSCTSVEEIILYKKNKEINIREALDNNIITPNDIVNSTLDIYSNDIEGNEDIS